MTVIVDQAGRILLEERRYPKEAWGLPGGLMELGESTEKVARREVFEVKDLKLLNVYSGPGHFVVAENGDEFYSVTVAYYTKNFEGDLNVDQTESISFQFFEPEKLPEKMVRSHQQIIADFLK